MTETCSAHGGYNAACPACQGTPFQPLVPGDFICMLIPRYDGPGGYVHEYHYGRVRDVNEHRATSYTDCAGVSRIVPGTSRQTWGVLARMLDAEEFWHGYCRRKQPFKTFADAQIFARAFLRLDDFTGPESMVRRPRIEGVVRSRSKVTAP